jgi:hypothetical protein
VWRWWVFHGHWDIWWNPFSVDILGKFALWYHVQECKKLESCTYLRLTHSIDCSNWWRSKLFAAWVSSWKCYSSFNLITTSMCCCTHVFCWRSLFDLEYYVKVLIPSQLWMKLVQGFHNMFLTWEWWSVQSWLLLETTLNKKSKVKKQAISSFIYSLGSGEVD